MYPFCEPFILKIVADPKEVAKNILEVQCSQNLASSNNHTSRVHFQDQEMGIGII
jgi:hypothetical protein